MPIISKSFKKYLSFVCLGWEQFSLRVNFKLWLYLKNNSEFGKVEPLEDNFHHNSGLFLHHNPYPQLLNRCQNQCRTHHLRMWDLRFITTHDYTQTIEWLLSQPNRWIESRLTLLTSQRCFHIWFTYHYSLSSKVCQATQPTPTSTVVTTSPL